MEIAIPIATTLATNALSQITNKVVEIGSEQLGNKMEEKIVEIIPTSIKGKGKMKNKKTNGSNKKNR